MKPARLGDAVVSMKNGMYKPASEYGDDGVPCLRMYNIDSGAIVWRDIKRMRVTADELEDYGLREGDLLVNRVNSRELVGKTACIPASLEPSVFESKNIRVRIDPRRALPKFISYQLLAGGRKHFEGNAQQVVGMASISQKQIADFPIVLTDLDEQRYIVAEIEKQFSRLDEAITGLQRVKANLKRYKAAVLKAAVEGRLVPAEADLARREGRSYETGAQLLQRILETRRSQRQGKGKYKEPAAPDTTNLPELPEGWVWATHVQTGEVTTGFTPPTVDAENFGGDIPFFKPTDLNAADNVVSAREYLSREGIAKGRKLPIGSILVTCIGATIGKTGYARVECATNQQINAISPTPDGALPSYVYFWTISPFAQRQIIDNASATTLPILNKSKFEALALALPPLAEQHRIVAEIDRLFSIAREAQAEVEANLKRAKALRSGILQSAFSP
jgi:type I restriction enzyme S subunit